MRHTKRKKERNAMREINDKCFAGLPYLIEKMRAENVRQLDKWGVQTRTPAEWILYLGEEYGELCQAVSEAEYRGGPWSAVLKEAIQTATLALKIAEMYMLFDKVEPAPPVVPKVLHQGDPGWDDLPF
jgi:hypothetical protein